MKNENRQKGDKIQFKEKEDLEYYVDIHEEIFDEKDKNRNCKYYPTKQYKTYKECDKNFTKKVFDDHGLKNFTPIWGTDAMEEVTEQTMCGEAKHRINRIFTGIEPNNCPMPCKSTSTNIRLLTITKSSGNLTYVTIYFSEEITITKVEMVEFDFVTSLSFLGSNMGLWLGLGTLQFAELLVNHFPNKVAK